MYAGIPIPLGEIGWQSTHHSRTEKERMNLTRNRIAAVLPLCLLLVGSAHEGSITDNHGDPAKPNIVLFYIDDLGWKDVGFNGSLYYETPNIDRLADEGIVFTDAYANAPNCAPSRASLMTGQYTPRHKIYTVGSSARGREENRRMIPVPNTKTLVLHYVTLAEALSNAGYTTGHFGKWHLGDTGFSPEDQGFDVNIGGYHSGSPRGGHFSPYNNPKLTDGPDGEYLTDRLTDEAIRFLDQNKEKPFFLYLAHYAVHTPIQAKVDLKAKYDHKSPDGGQDNPTYAAMIESTDQSVGRVLDRLESLEMARNTVVIFYSDNGGAVQATSNEPLRGYKGMLYEGGIRVPLAIKWPGEIIPGRVNDTPVIGIDLYPTLLAIAGAEAPAHVMDGVSLMPLLAGTGGLTARNLYWHFPAYLEAPRGFPGPWRTTPAGGIRRGEYKLIEFLEDGIQELYDLRSDPGEATNLADEMPDLAKELHGILRNWREEVGADMPTPK